MQAGELGDVVGRDRLRAIEEIFIATLKAHLPRLLDEALASDELARMAHHLRGSAATLQMPPLSRAAEAAEKSADKLVAATINKNRAQAELAKSVNAVIASSIPCR